MSPQCILRSVRYYKLPLVSAPANGPLQECNWSLTLPFTSYLQDKMLGTSIMFPRTCQYVRVGSFTFLNLLSYANFFPVIQYEMCIMKCFCFLSVIISVFVFLCYVSIFLYFYFSWHCCMELVHVKLIHTKIVSILCVPICSNGWTIWRTVVTWHGVLLKLCRKVASIYSSSIYTVNMLPTTDCQEPGLLRVLAVQQHYRSLSRGVHSKQ